jgi:hypothetical protein
VRVQCKTFDKIRKILLSEEKKQKTFMSPLAPIRPGPGSLHERRRKSLLVLFFRKEHLPYFNQLSWLAFFGGTYLGWHLPCRRLKHKLSEPLGDLVGRDRRPPQLFHRPWPDAYMQQDRARQCQRLRERSIEARYTVATKGLRIAAG